MASKLFVGSLSYNVTNDQLQELFAAFGKVESAAVIIDRDTDRSKGFGFVEMSTDEEAQAAINGLNGKEVDGRTLAVSVAKPKTDRPARPSFGGSSSNGGGRRRY
jgi:RNA recognition motif-containing protein